ncbi:MAG: ester cyclase [Candidatus Promineifilaceae bacterium]|nr:ester cyclase [Candidatus Promineifilaceae bacterium]
MSTETNKAIVRRFFDQIINNQRHDLLEEFLDENTAFHGPGPSYVGLAALKEWFAMYAAALPDLHTTIHDIIAEGNSVVLRYTGKGTHLGEMQGIPATGKTYTQQAIVIYHLSNGKIVEGWVQTDLLSMMQQLGLMPAPQTA